MSKTKLFNLLLIVTAIIGGVISSFYTIADGNLYGTLIRLAIIPVMLVPYILKKYFKKEIPLSIESIYLVFIFFALFLGSIMNLYYVINDYDKVIHFLSGILSTMLALIILIKYKKYDKKSIIFNIIFMLAITMLIASCWEFYEFKFDILFTKDAQRVLATGVNDTMYDMIAAFIGSALISFMYLVDVIKNKGMLTEQFIRDLKK